MTILEFIGKLINVARNISTNRFAITFELDEGNIGEVDNINDKKLRVIAKQYRQKRSLTSNGYAWHLMQEIAEKSGLTKNDVYIECLKKYSRAFTHMIVHPEVIPRLAEDYRVVVDLGEVLVNGKVGHQIQLYFGSSKFDTKEMSVFLDGIISECRDLGIDVIPQSDIDKLNAEWDVARRKETEND